MWSYEDTGRICPLDCVHSKSNINKLLCYASKFTGHANSKFLDAIYRKKTDANLYYVIVLETTSKEEASDRSRLLREDTEFKDAWSYFGHLEHAEPLITKTQPTAIIEPIDLPIEIEIEILED